ncbi:MAG: sulfatase-like hydrolase/transferase [Sedimentisphaeraceae bacterium JB056]
MLRRDFIKLTAAGLLTSANLSLANAEKNSTCHKPNILLIVADDLGHGDLSCFAQDGMLSPQEKKSGHKLPSINTPNIDAIAADGIKLTDFYANGPVCSPTRTALMTGRYQHRSGVVNVLGQTGNAYAEVYPEDKKPFAGLDEKELTIAEVLQTGGYRTACIGKWHLGPFYLNQGYHPLDYGFDYFVGPSGNAGDNFSMQQDGLSYFWRNRKRAKSPGYYFTDVLADEAICFMKKKSNKPFFVYLPFTAPHGPLVGPNDKEDANKWDEKGHFRTDFGRAYKEIVEALDKAVGRVMASLKEMNIEGNTFVMFISDNGQCGFGRAPFNQHQGKQTVYEGGIRVPAMMKWKGKIPKGKVISQPLATMDIFPTLISVSGCKLPANAKTLDGIDMTPIFSGKPTGDNRMLFWEAPYQVWIKYFANRIWAVRQGKWKLMQSHITEPLELYDLENDPAEINNIADKNPQIVKEMHKAFQKWFSDVYADCPYNLEDFIERLKENGLITKESTEEVKEGY